MSEPIFLSLEEILFIHDKEIEIAGGEPSIRDKEDIKACVGMTPKASFWRRLPAKSIRNGGKLHCLFDNTHPFVDGNKRTALASALTFLISKWT